MDSVFSKEDIEQILEAEVKDTKWDSTNTIFNNKKIIWINGYYSKNFISKPYYNEKTDHAFLVSSHNVKGTTTTFYVFKKEEEDWLLIDKIENVGW